MENFWDFSQIQETLASAQTVFVFLPQHLNQDKVAAALALYLSLKKFGKKTAIFCPQPMTVEFSSLVGVDRIGEKLAGKILVISFDIENSTQKVSYNVENNKLKIFVQPKEDFPPLSPKKVEYSYSGGQADLAFIIGASTLKELGEIYLNNKDLFEGGKTVNLDINPKNDQFAKTNLVYPEAASYSEVVTGLVAYLNLPIDADIATNLLAGIENATTVFSSAKAGAATFEAAAFCLKAGARRFQEKVRLTPMPKDVSAEKPAPDWFEPKIYKGNTLI